MDMEGKGKPEAAGALFLQAWNEATNDWVRQTPEELRKWREKLANVKGEIIN